MKKTLLLNKKYIQGTLILLWVIMMSYSSSYVFIYFLIALLGLFSMRKNREENYSLNGWCKVITLGFAVLFSLASILANYELFDHWFQQLTMLPIVLFGGICLAENIVTWCFFATAKMVNGRYDRYSGKKPTLVFLTVFCTIVAFDFLFFFCTEYPGNLTPDSIDQITQSITGNYGNHHPYWHTVVIKFWISFGYKLFGNYNDAVALYSVWQILFVATCFSFSITTLYQACLPKCCIIGAWVMYLCMPYNIAYSFTMWKDVVFGGAVLVFVVSLYRLLKEIGENKGLNYSVFLLSGIACGVWRTNGWIAMVAAFGISCFFLKKECKRLLLMWAIALLVSGWMRGPVIESLNIPQPDLVESLSIPVQQVARVIYEGHTLEAHEIESLEKVVDVEEIPDLYQWYISDPIKNEIRSKNNEYFVSHILEYLKLWIRVGLRYPAEYVKAWIDQTKGYWNSGYDYWVMQSYIHDNNYGIHKVKLGYPILRKILYDFGRFPQFDIIFSIGLHVWSIVLATIINALHKKKEMLISIPVLMIVGTLLIATPVYSEFRYAYSVFTTLPLVIITTIWDGKAHEDLSSQGPVK